MLLDLDSTTDSANETRTEATRSPALNDLQGLDFEQSPTPSISQPSPLAVANVNPAFEDHLHEEQESSSSDIGKDADSADAELAAEYKREIDIICKLLEGASLSETFLSKLTECKQELEARLRLRRAPNTNTAQSQQLLGSQAPKLKQSPPATPKQEESEVVVTEHKQPETVSSEAIRETPKHGHSHSRTTSSVSRDSTPSSLPRLNAEAPKFMPSSFSEYRSLSNATSTDSSTVLQPTPSKVINRIHSESVSSDTPVVMSKKEKPSPQSHADAARTESTLNYKRVSSGSHIIGDDLLPGRRVKKPVEFKKPDGTHLFGKQLSPGRHGTPPAKPAASAKPESTLTR